MGYELDAILAKKDDIGTFQLTSALVYPLTDQLGLIPNTQDFGREVAAIQDWARQASQGTMVAHLTAEFFGGMGGHSCTLWVDGDSESELDINNVLDRFGIEPRSGRDQFDAVGFGRCRSTAGWAALAVLEPICESICHLIAALAYDCVDGGVRAKVRSGAAGYLGRLKAVDAIDALKESLDDSDYGTRLGAACALAEIGEPAVPVLIGALGGQDNWNIVYALTKVGAPALLAVPYLIPLLHDEDWRIRLQTIEALVAIGSVGKEVEALLKDSEKLVRDAARDALK